MKKPFVISAGLIAGYFILTNSAIHSFMSSMGEFGLIGVLVAGAFFSSFVTTVPAIAALSFLGTIFNPLVVAALGALGAVLADFMIFKTEKSPIEDLESNAQKYKMIRKAEGTRMFETLRFFSPLLGGLVLASPLPDELAVAIWDSIHLSPVRFFFLAYISKFLGIFFIANATRVIL